MVRVEVLRRLMMPAVEKAICKGITDLEGFDGVRIGHIFQTTAF